MLQHPTSAATSSRPDAEDPNVQQASRPVLKVLGYRPRAADRHLLALVCEHQVLTTGQLVRLAGMPERTVQHRLGVLYRAGLVSRHRPRAAVGTSPYHVWLTAFGAEAIGAGPSEPWSRTSRLCARSRR
jgi:DNA-binding transcriptional ArsR family regulator